MRSSSSRPPIAFIGAGIGLPAEGSSGQGIPTLIALLGQLSSDFDIVIYSLIRIEKSLVPDGIEVRQVTALPLPMRLKYMLLLGRLLVDYLSRNFQVFVAVSAFPAGRMAVFVGKLLGVPAVIQLIGSEAVGMPEIGYGDLLNERLSKIVRRVCRRADGIITMSDFHKKVVQQNLQMDRPITVLPLRIDVKKFPLYKPCISHPVQFLHIGAYQPVKDQDTLFRAFAIILKSVSSHLTVIGDGFRSPRVEQLLNDLGIRNHVTLVGVVRNQDLTEYFSRAQIFLNSSIFESGCGVAQEAMASGVPVCATAVGILADLGEAFASTVQPGKVEELASRAIALVQDPERYRNLQANAYQYIATHEMVWAAKQYKAYFKTLIEVKVQNSSFKIQNGGSNL